MTTTSHDRDAASAEGDRRRNAGIHQATNPARRRPVLLTQQAELLDAVLSSPNGEATMNDVTAPPEKHADGGKWRGAVPQFLRRRGLICAVGYTISIRPARHAGPVRVWAADAPPEALVSARDALRILAADAERAIAEADSAGSDNAANNLEQRDLFSE